MQVLQIGNEYRESLFQELFGIMEHKDVLLCEYAFYLYRLGLSQFMVEYSPTHSLNFCKIRTSEVEIESAGFIPFIRNSAQTLVVTPHTTAKMSFTAGSIVTWLFMIEQIALGIMHVNEDRAQILFNVMQDIKYSYAKLNFGGDKLSSHDLKAMHQCLD